MTDTDRKDVEAADLQFRQRRQASHTLAQDVISGLREMASDIRRGTSPDSMAERLDAAATALVNVRAEVVNGLELEGVLRRDLKKADDARFDAIDEMRALRRDMDEADWGRG